MATRFIERVASTGQIESYPGVVGISEVGGVLVANIAGSLKTLVDTTSIQSLANKSFPAPVLTAVPDSTFSIADDGDATKLFKFQVSGVTTGTTRTWTVPDSNDTFVGKATTDTLTNKTLTAPAITSPVITGKPTTYSTVTTYLGATDAIDISLGDIFMLSRAAGADAATLAAPSVGDNGRIIRIISGTAFAHTITIAGGVGGAGGGDDVVTFTNRVAASITLFAHNQQWYVVGSYLAAIA